MTAFNIVRMRVKPGHEKDYVELHRNIEPDRVERMRAAGLRRFTLVDTGDRSFCVIGEWDSFESIVKARSEMIDQLGKMRDILEDLGHDLGVTDPVSGEVALELEPRSNLAAE